MVSNHETCVTSGQVHIRFVKLKVKSNCILLLQKYWYSKFADLFWDSRCLLEGCT